MVPYNKNKHRICIRSTVKGADIPIQTNCVFIFQKCIVVVENV